MEIFCTKIWNSFPGSEIDLTPNVKYSKLIEKIELMSNLIDFMLLKLTGVGLMVPPLILTVFEYFVLDLDEKSFYLTFPVV